MRRVVLALLLTGCAGSRITGGTGDAGEDDPDGTVVITDARTADRMLTPEDVDAATPTIDAQVAPDAAAAPCDLLAPFGAPSSVPLTIVNSTTAIDSAPTFAPDGLTLFFASTRTGGPGAYDIWQSTRSSLTAAWTMPTVVGGVNSPQNDYGITLSPNQMTAYFVSERTDGGALGMGDVWKATRGGTTGPFTNAMLLGDVSTSAQETDPWLSADGTTLLFASNRPGSDLLDFWQAPYNAGLGTFGGATRATDLNSTSLEFGATMTANNLTVAFASNRPGSQGFDLYLATRTTPTGSFPTPMLIPGMNSPQNDLGAALSPNGCELVFSSNRGTSQDLYIATRPTGP